MALEDLTGTDKFIDDFVATNPVGPSDRVKTLDDHIRGIKNVLQNQFPNLDAAVTLTPAEMNLLVGVGAVADKNAANTFLNTITIAPTSIDSSMSLNGATGRDAYIYLKENNVAAFLIWNNSASNKARLRKFDAVGVSVSNIEFDESGNINVSQGNFQLAGSSTASAANTLTFTNKTHTNPVLNGTATGTAIGTGANQLAAGNHTHSSLQAISFRAYVTADESAVGSGVVNSTNLSNLSEDFDNGGYFAIATGYFQPSVAGYYHVGMSLYLTTNLAGDNIEGTIRKNAAGTIMAIDNTESDSSSKEGGVSPSTTMYFNGSTDYVFFYHDQSTGWTMKAGSQIYGHFVHA